MWKFFTFLKKFFSSLKLPTVNRLNKNLDFLPLSWRFASQCQRVGRWWWWKQNNLFCFLFFFLFFLKTSWPAPDKNLSRCYSSRSETETYKLIIKSKHTMLSINLLFYVLYYFITLLLYGTNYFILSEVCTCLRLKSVALMFFLCEFNIVPFIQEHVRP